MTAEKSQMRASLAAAKARREHIDALLDEALRETFPASDPIAISLPKEPAPDSASPEPGPTNASHAEQSDGDAPGAAVEATLFSSEAALVEHLLPVARKRLAVMAQDAPLSQAARLLLGGTDLIVACDAAGAMVGIITKTDVVGVFAECEDSSCATAASAVMSRDVVACRPGDALSAVWTTMKKRNLKNVPILDDGGQPVGVLNVRDALHLLLREVTNQESLLRDYVMGVGYQ